MIVATSAAARPFTAKDLASLDRVSSPSISPDGRYVAYAVRTTDWDATRASTRSTSSTSMAIPSKPLVLLSGEKGGPSSSWSRGRALALLHFRKVGIGAGLAVRPDWVGSAAADLPSRSTSRRSSSRPTMHTMFVAADVYPDCATLACTKERDDAKAKEKGSAIEIKSGQPRCFDNYLDDKFLSLFRGRPRPARRSRRRSADRQGISLPTFRPTGNRVGCHVERRPDGLFRQQRPGGGSRLGQAFSRIYAVPADGSGCPARTRRDGRGRHSSSPALSPDGRSLAYLAVTAPALLLRPQRGDDHGSEVGPYARGRADPRRGSRSSLPGRRTAGACSRAGYERGQACCTGSIRRAGTHQDQFARNCQRVRQRARNYCLRARKPRVAATVVRPAGIGG